MFDALATAPDANSIVSAIRDPRSAIREVLVIPHVAPREASRREAEYGVEREGCGILIRSAAPRLSLAPRAGQGWYEAP